VDQVVAYARHVSFTAAPPPFWDGQAPMAPAEPPVPTPAAIRASRLYASFLAERERIGTPRPMPIPPCSPRVGP
jgi:hypothetical protein